MLFQYPPSNTTSHVFLFEAIQIAMFPSAPSPIHKTKLLPKTSETSKISKTSYYVIRDPKNPSYINLAKWKPSKRTNIYICWDKRVHSTTVENSGPRDSLVAMATGSELPACGYDVLWWIWKTLWGVCEMLEAPQQECCRRPRRRESSSR